MADDDNHIGSSYLLGEIDRMIKLADDTGDDTERTMFVVLRGIYTEMRSLKMEVRRNPFFVIGALAQKYPKSALGVLTLSIVLIVANLYHVGIKPVLLALFAWLGIPEELVP